MFNLQRDAPWFFQHLENYHHLFLSVRFNNGEDIPRGIKFSVELSIQGFEGLLFYMYKPEDRRVDFNLYKHSIDQTHDITDLKFMLNQKPFTPMDLVIIPFGYFKDEHKFNLNVHSDDVESSFDLYSWSPSNLYKNIKSVIKIANQYSELIPIDDYRGYYFHFSSAFKGNETGRLFDLINLLVDFDKSVDEIDNSPIFEPMDLEIKNLVSKSNNFLFELCHTSVPLDVKNIVRELERLKFNIDSLSKEEIFNWLDNLIAFYAEKS